MSRPTSPAHTPRVRRTARRCHLRLEALEDRCVPANLLVTTGDDAGAGSLRDALATANANNEADTITFAPAVTTVSLTSAELRLTEKGAANKTTILGTAGAPVTITRSGDAAANFRILNLDEGTFADLSFLKITGGKVEGNGGGILNAGTLALSGVDVSGNELLPAIFVVGGAGISTTGPLSITNSTISNNTTGGGAGGIDFNGGAGTITNSTISGNAADATGGVATNNRLVIIGSTISGNVARKFSAGGISVNVGGNLTLVNSTLSGNTSGLGGAALGNEEVALLTNVTITGNRAGTDVATTSGAILNVPNGFAGGTPVLTLHNTIVAGNFRGATGTTPSDFSTDQGSVDVAAASSNNLVGHAAASGGLTHGTNGNVVGQSGSGTLDIATVLNTTLANNGGATLTHALAADSLAANRGNNARAVDAANAALTTDQRGGTFARTIGGTVDIGAFESPRTDAPVPLPAGGTPNERFVRQLYRDLVGREAESAGLAFWVGRLQNVPGARGRLALEIQDTTEAKARALERIFQRYLGRAIDGNALLFFQGFLARGNTLEAAAVEVIASAEYFNRAGGTNDLFIAAVFRDVVGRPADPAGQAFWVAEIARSTRGAVAKRIFATPEAKTLQANEAFTAVLRRAGDTAGLTFFTGQLNSGQPAELVRANLFGSDEYLARVVA